MSVEMILVTIVLTLAGAGAGFFYRDMKLKKDFKSFEEQAEDIINKANEKAEKTRRNAKNDAKQIIK